MSLSKHTVKDIRRMNRTAVLQLLYFSSPISRLEISQRSGLSPATVTSVVAELLEEGVIAESGLEESRGGRPRTTLVMNPDYGFFFGVDVAETHVHTQLFNLTLQKLGDIRYMLPSGDTEPEELVGHIVEGIESLTKMFDVPAQKVIGVGIGIPGIVDHREGVSIFAPNWGWHNVFLLDMLKENLKFPLHIDNDAQAMTLAELWFGAGHGADNLAVLLIGTGVGAGIMIQGSLYRGTSNSAGEWGHTCIELNGRDCLCGSQGCIEAYVGAPGIIERLRALDPNTSLIHEQDQVKTMTAIREAALAGNSNAIEVLNETAQYLGAGIANLINFFNPNRIVLGGWVGMLLGDYMLPEIRQTVEHYALKQPLSATTISLSKLGDESIRVGAACLALDDFLKAEPAPMLKTLQPAFGGLRQQLR